MSSTWFDPWSAPRAEIRRAAPTCRRLKPRYRILLIACFVLCGVVVLPFCQWFAYRLADTMDMPYAEPFRGDPGENAYVVSVILLLTIALAGVIFAPLTAIGAVLWARGQLRRDQLARFILRGEAPESWYNGPAPNDEFAHA